MSLYVMPSSCSLFFIREARAAVDKSVYLVAQLHALREDKRQVYVCNYYYMQHKLPYTWSTS